MRGCRHIFLLLGLVLITDSLYAECSDPPLISRPEFQSDVRPAIDDLYNREPEVADAHLTPWMERCPEHPVWEFWRALKLWWEVLEELEDTQLDDELTDQLNRAREAGSDWIDSRPDSPDGWFVRALSEGLLARLHANRGRWVRSILVARHARDASEELEKKLPSLADHRLARGLTLYYSEWLPDRYTVLRPFRWAMPGGDREEGLRQLEIASRTSLFVRAESTYFSGLIQLRYEERPEKAVESFRFLADRYPQNRFYQRIFLVALLEAARSAEQASNPERALEHYRTVLNRSWNSGFSKEMDQIRLEALAGQSRLSRRGERSGR